jgi:alpha-L-rhamnosidase
VASLVLVPAVAARAAPARPVGPGPPVALTVQERRDPIGVDRHAVEFGWHVNDARRGATQRAYELRVTTAPSVGGAGPAPVWSSGMVASGQQSFVPYGGPPLLADAAYAWTVRTWDADGQAGPFAAPARFETGLDDGEWQADWIRRGSATPGAEEYTYARKEVTLGSSPITRARAYASADHQYQLFVNGVRADQGPSFNDPDRQYYQATDVTGLLRAGRANALGLLLHWYGYGKGRPPGAPGVILHLSVEHRDGTRETITTDGTWRVHAAEWKPSTLRNEQGDTVEKIDERAHPAGWGRPGFADAAWEPALVVGAHPVAPWTHLQAQTTRVSEARITPVAVHHLSTGATVADFGRVYAAVPSVTFRDGSPGHDVQMQAGYAVESNGEVSITKAVQETDMSYEYVQARGTHTFRPFSYLGFRYFEVQNPGRDLQAGDLVAYARHAAMPDEQAATFRSGNATVDAVWELARHSALYGSQEQFVDTPTREKGQFLTDAFNISSTTMRAFGERNLTQQALADFASSQARYWPDGRVNAIDPAGQGKRDIPDYTESYPLWVWQYYLDTGDRARLAALYPVLARIADYVNRAVDPATGLVTNLPGGTDEVAYTGGIVDGPAAMRYGYDVQTAARTTVNVLGVEVFRRVGQAATALGDTAAAAVERRREAALGAAINARLTRADGVYVDGLKAGGAPSAHASQHANAYALAAGIVPAARVQTVAGYVAGHLAMGPMTALNLLRALHVAGRDADLVAILTDKAQPGWARVLALGGTYTWESWAPSDQQGDSESHAWGANVLLAIQQALLGVTPRSPGYARVAVAPPDGGLGAASGRVPTDRGPIDVAWSLTKHGRAVFRLRLGVPANVTATVSIPTTDASRVSESGRPAARAAGVRLVRVERNAAVYEVGAGSYAFTAGP